MPDSIGSTTHVSIPSSAPVSGSSASGGRIAAILKQIENLQRQLLELREGGSGDATKQAELIQKQIQLLQAELAQLRAEQQKAAQEARQTPAAAPGATSADGEAEVDIYI
ncbi:MAG: FlxA-like family protein [Azonexus sp.]|jgi:uncharacterized protein involved in exopolysaccharide biosynthesis|uniref:FlxA-like family protein n=1 Tax=Azonexus sp. TaxID=1872668 RepID=UPI00282D6A84|nr:FlxA-like family protein [Azonexus sp.]MDR0776043.1 FlxA-like family protein [Azonexus sp.]